MKKIDERIQWYEKNSSNYDDDLSRIELMKIKELYAAYDKRSERSFMTEAIAAFYKIIEIQKEHLCGISLDSLNEADIEMMMGSLCEIEKKHRELISCLEDEPIRPSENDCDFEEDNPYPDFDFLSVGEKSFGYSYIPFRPLSKTPVTDNGATINEGFQNDKQLQAAFTSYCLENGKSSYTANDYCSRIKNLWKTFYNEYKEGKLEDDLKPNKEMIDPNSPLLSVFHHTELLSRYIMIKIDETDGNRNWTNTRAAFNKFDKFRCGIENNQENI